MKHLEESNATNVADMEEEADLAEVEKAKKKEAAEREAAIAERDAAEAAARAELEKDSAMLTPGSNRSEYNIRKVQNVVLEAMRIKRESEPEESSKEDKPAPVKIFKKKAKKEEKEKTNTVPIINVSAPDGGGQLVLTDENLENQTNNKANDYDESTEDEIKTNPPKSGLNITLFYPISNPKFQKILKKSLAKETTKLYRQ